MLVATSEPSIATRLAALLSVLGATIVVLASCVLTSSSWNDMSDSSPEALTEMTEELPSESEKEGASKSDAELETDTLSLVHIDLIADAHEAHERLSPPNPCAFLPLRSREFERELFRPPQRAIAA